MQALAFGGIALFLPLIQEELGLTFSQAGTIAASSTLIYALMQVPAGYATDRYGAKRLFAIGLLGSNLLSLALALVHTYGWMLVNQAASGFFRALVFAPGLMLVRSAFPSDRRSTAMGLYVAGGFSSSIVLNLFGPFMVEPLGWRGTFVVFSLVGLVLVGLHWWLGTDPVRPPGSTVPHLRELADLLRGRVLWLAGVVQFVRLAVVTATRFWLPTYLVGDKGFTLQAAGVVVALSAAITAPSNIIGGYVADRLQRPIAVIATSLVVLAVCCILLVPVESAVGVVVIVMVFSVFVQVYFGPLFEVPLQLLGDRAAGSVNGFSNFCANLGGLTFAYTLGAVRDATGSFALGFALLAGLCLVGLGATALLARCPPAPTAPAPQPAPQAAG